jgi:hypothetical protein
MTPEIVSNSIVAALSAGAAAGATDTAKSAIADAYQGLKRLVKKKFGHDSDVAEAIDKIEAKPDSGARREVLAEELKAINSASDPELVSAAQSLLALIKSRPARRKAPPGRARNRHCSSRPGQHSDGQHFFSIQKR